MNIHTILVPVDLSDCSTHVVNEAADLALKHGARVELLHITRMPSGLRAETKIDPAGDGQTTTAADYLAADASLQMSRYEQICSRLGVGCDQVVIPGRPVEQILGHAAVARADLIVMGTHGRRGVSRAVLGSVAEQVLRRAAAPVLIIRARRTPDCEASTCDWCASGVNDAQRRVAAEQDG
jgi:nucleotide-binding universal stress UspA family protein